MENININVNFNKIIGAVKPMHGVGQPPFSGCDFGMFRYLTEAGIPFSRLHDVGGVYGEGRWVDIPNIFRDFKNDPTDPASYDFTFTDLLISALINSGTEPFFRLGVTIENDALIKSYRIDPPSDYRKWAVICEHIIRHYTEGWADGFKYNIRYWEIWNEPDNFENPAENQMWHGVKEQYYELYNITSKHLKKCFPHLKIGGYASCGFYALQETFVAGAKSSRRSEYFIEFFDGFLNFIKENNCPLDFFSWHSYDGIENNIVYANYVRKRLDDAGYTDTETTCNEWNSEIDARGTPHHAAVICAMLTAFQNTPLDSAMFYDARFGTSVYGGLFNPLTAEPFPAYYAFKAFNELYNLKNQAEVSNDVKQLYVLAARNDDRACVLISNPTDKDVYFTLNTDAKVTNCFLNSNGNFFEESVLPKLIPADSFLLVNLNAKADRNK